MEIRWMTATMIDGYFDDSNRYTKLEHTHGSFEEAKREFEGIGYDAEVIGYDFALMPVILDDDDTLLIEDLDEKDIVEVKSIPDVDAAESATFESFDEMKDFITQHEDNHLYWSLDLEGIQGRYHSWYPARSVLAGVKAEDLDEYTIYFA